MRNKIRSWLWNLVLFVVFTPILLKLPRTNCLAGRTNYSICNGYIKGEGEASHPGSLQQSLLKSIIDTLRTCKQIISDNKDTKVWLRKFPYCEIGYLDPDEVSNITERFFYKRIYMRLLVGDQEG
jgi:hypothetical protein